VRRIKVVMLSPSLLLYSSILSNPPESRSLFSLSSRLPVAAQPEAQL
jgi:hypothetical protein